MNKTDFDNELRTIKKWITSSKTKHLEGKKKLNSLRTWYYNFFLGRIYFTSNVESLNTFVHQTILDILELKKDEGIDYVLVEIKWSVQL